MHGSAAQRVAAEALGSLLLLAGVVGSGIMGESLSPANAAVALLGNTLATGAILVVLIRMLGPVSGAHFNPAVTLAFWLRRDLPARLALGYIGAQVAGAVLGVLLAHAMFEQPLWQPGLRVRSGGAQWLAEGVATCGLLLTIFGTLRVDGARVPEAVGLYIVAAYWFTASTSFANPAVTLARSLTQSFAGIRPEDVLGFVLAQFAGAALGIVLARALGFWRDAGRA